jgi:hypothetical protein
LRGWSHDEEDCSTVLNQISRFRELVLMDFDDVALGVMEEDLLSTPHGPSTVIREGDARLAQRPLERFDVIRPERDVAALEGVDRVLGAKADAEVPLRQAPLGRAIGDEGHPPA